MFLACVRRYWPQSSLRCPAGARGESKADKFPKKRTVPRSSNPIEKFPTRTYLRHALSSRIRPAESVANPCC
jgi:hypothetical protein